MKGHPKFKMALQSYDWINSYGGSQIGQFCLMARESAINKATGSKFILDYIVMEKIK